ncbi:MAG: Gfo/Idh/MocA family oxidoreductase [Chloroflexi bacterium]|nr:Gfo/Idh/MocA family oxidoreductase [Chloroflexota bacterium]MCY3583444.1 Gfo/Idh/MocA family oxidoreductase [Chloroflexota bacterium]MCY3715066.1 Gfo/Idh/MocA family oxidoreductase [Chloroflexota bacterium]MDE2651613.1 Gfo/Idh/MocA family oxidoreductase [Chloroflexota bacterium]MXV94146.1 Gfo/Idh/MocA family oxidoreductase [Chloroflexota bacterium]
MMTGNSLSIGMVGSSWWADAMHLPALDSHTQARTTAICGRNRERAQAMAAAWGIPQVYTDFAQMIDQADLDAIIIATPNNSHYPITMRALRRGLHVLCEKPIAMTYAQAREMAQTAAESNLKSLVPFTYSFMPTARYLKELIDGGYIGAPYHLNMRYYTGYAREGDYRWRFDKRIAGTGVLGDLGSHFLYIAEWLYGEIVTLTCRLSHSVPRPKTDPAGAAYPVGDDGCMMTVEFANGAMGMIHCTALCYEDTPFGQTHHMEFHGAGGTLYSSTDWDTVQRVKGARVGEGAVRDLPIPDYIWGDARRDTVHNTYRDIFRSEDFMIRGFINSILQDKPLKPDLADGARIQRLLEAAELSHVAGERIKVADIA